MRGKQNGPTKGPKRQKEEPSAGQKRQAESPLASTLPAKFARQRTLSDSSSSSSSSSDSTSSSSSSDSFTGMDDNIFVSPPSGILSPLPPDGCQVSPKSSSQDVGSTEITASTSPNKQSLDPAGNFCTTEPQRDEQPSPKPQNQDQVNKQSLDSAGNLCTTEPQRDEQPSPKPQNQDQVGKQSLDSADNRCTSETQRDEQPSPKPQNKDQVDRVTSDWEMPTGIQPFHTKFCIHSVVCQNHHIQGVSQHCLPGKPFPVPQKTGGKNNLVPTYRTLRQPLHSLSNNPDLCRRQNLHLKGSHDFHLCSVHVHHLLPPGTARQIFLHDTPPQYHPGYYPSGPNYLPYRQQSPWRPQYIDIPDRRSCYAAIGADPRVAFRGAPSLEHRSGIADFIRNVRRQALSNGRREITVNFPANCCCMIKTEEAIMPNGTVYRLKTNWVKEPSETIEAPPPQNKNHFPQKFGTNLKGNITFVCAHTANAAWFFPAITVVTSNVTQKCQRRISGLFVSGVLCFKYALRNMCYMRILIYWWNFEKKIRKMHY